MSARPHSRRRSTTQTGRPLGDAALERAPELPELQHTKRGWVWAGKDYPAARIPLRSTSPDSFTVVDVDTGSLLGLVERERAYSTVHDGAVYLHLGEPYLVEKLDLDARHALVQPFTGDWYTQAKKETMTEIAEPLRVEQRMGMEVTFGRVVVTEQVVGYQRKSIRDQSTLDLVHLDMPNDRVRDRGGLGTSRRTSTSRTSTASPRSSAPSTPPSTR
jgi:DEAD/DEAH box helicase domain-containing protein